MRRVGGLGDMLALLTSRMSLNSNENVALLCWVFHWHSVQMHFELVRTKCEVGLCEALKILNALEFEKLVLQNFKGPRIFTHTFKSLNSVNYPFQ